MASKLNIRSITMINTSVERLLLNAVLISFALLAFSYLLLLGNMVKDVVQRKSFEAKSRLLSVEVQDLEVAYLNASNSIDLNLSRSLGFKEAQTTFTSNTSLGAAETVQNEL